MDEKPKSIWKKLFTGRMALVIWLGVATFALILGSYMAALAHFSYPMCNWVESAGIVAAICFGACLILIYIVWPLLRWLFWKHWRRTLFALACLATVIALFYAEENWRGKHDWEQFKREWEAKGEKFDFKDFVPPPVPDEQNFAMAPIWVESIKATLGSKRARRWYGDKFPDNGRTNFTERLQLEIWHQNSKLEEPGSGDWHQIKRTDLKGWQDYYRATNGGADSRFFTNKFSVAPLAQLPAQDVLLALSKYDSAVEDLRQVSLLPFSRFPLEYDAEDPASILLPHLADLKRCSQVLRLRAVAELQNGQSEKALDDVKLALRLADSVRTEPFIITHLVRIAILEITLQPVWEGLAEHKWSDAQLTALDAELAKLDFMADCQKVQKSEIFFSAEEANYLRRHRGYDNQFAQMGVNNPGDAKFKFAIYRYMPGGWFYQSALKNGRRLMEYLPAVNHDTKTISPALIRRADAAANNAVSFFDPLDSLKKMFNAEFLFMGNFLKKIAAGQSSVDLARVAIALERYRLAHGEYPESLDALAPQFIAKVPHDVIGGQPLKYRREANGQFVLYSVGWNEKDDGGAVEFTQGNTPTVDISQGDWVWRYPKTE
ncbi:MAG: hypothetical protein PHY43_00405 [Verrucomicrobiales bacterium]|nr:hypothetical protein [Verrucomicrobiales bacterium]